MGMSSSSLPSDGIDSSPSNDDGHVVSHEYEQLYGGSDAEHDAKSAHVGSCSSGSAIFKKKALFVAPAELQASNRSWRSSSWSIHQISSQRSDWPFKQDCKKRVSGDL